MMTAPSPPVAATGPFRPKAVLLDVNQTLFPLEPLRQRFRDVGLHGPQDLEVWRLINDLCCGMQDRARHFPFRSAHWGTDGLEPDLVIARVARTRCRDASVCPRSSVSMPC